MPRCSARLGARAHAALLTAAERQRRQAQTLFHIQRTDALGCADFVAGNAHQVAVPFFRSQAYTAKTLHGINVEQCLGCLGLEQPAELFDRLHRADLVVDQLAGEKNRVLGQCFAQHLGRDVTVASGARKTTSKPSAASCFAVLTVAACSISVVMMRPFLCRLR